MKKKHPNRKPPPEKYRWKKGQSGNPGGLKPNPHKNLLKKIATLTHDDLVTQTSELWNKPVYELMEILEEAKKKPSDGGGKCTAGRAVIAAVMAHAISKGDHKRMDSILNRIVGRPAETIKLLGAFAHKHVQHVPVTEILKDPEMAERYHSLASFVAEKTLTYQPNEAEAAQEAIAEGEIIE